MLMRKRNSGEKPVVRIWLVQNVSASSSVACHGDISRCWLLVSQTQ